MATVTFDTLKFVEKLRAAGVPEAQAKVQAEVLVFALDEVTRKGVKEKGSKKEKGSGLDITVFQPSSPPSLRAAQPRGNPEPGHRLSRMASGLLRWRKGVRS